MIKSFDDVFTDDIPRIVNVVMSVYNGEKYLSEQLDSIMNQTYKVNLFIRDDGSKDRSVEIIKEYKKKYNNIFMKKGKNLGVVRSFMDCLKWAVSVREYESEEIYYEYFAFSDQDDIWDSDKIEAGISILEKKNYVFFPCLYAANQRLVDGDGNDTHSRRNHHKKRPSFGNAVIENICAGCTEIMNYRLASLVCMTKDEYIKGIEMHDWWVYLIASYCGSVVYDDRDRLSYRQHESNSVGTNTTALAEWEDRIRRYKSNRNHIYTQLCYFKRFARDLENEIDDFYADYWKKQLINALISGKKNPRVRGRLACDKMLRRQRLIDNLVFKPILFFGKY